MALSTSTIGYITVIQMAPGARAWTAGAIVFAFLAWAVRRAERRGTESS